MTYRHEISLTISVDEWGEYRVFIPLPPFDAFLVGRRAQDRSSFWIDDLDESWTMVTDRETRLHVGASWHQDRCGLEIVGSVRHHDLDYTRTPTEIGLDERLAVARVAKKLLAIGAET